MGPGLRCLDLQNGLKTVWHWEEKALGDYATLLADDERVLVGTPTGNLYQSTDGGGSWKLVASKMGRAILTIAYDPYRAGVVLAGTQNGGIWRSGDGGASWAADPGSERRTVRGFGFGPQLTLAGTDTGVLVSRSSRAWTSGGLGQGAVSAVAVASATDPVRLVVGGDTTRGDEALPLFDSGDGGQSWELVEGAVGGSSMVSALAAGPADVSGNRPLLMGTNTGLFASTDSGADWQAVTGSGGLPATDCTALAYVGPDATRFYIASDGGASPQGGLWSTADGGTHFTSLSPPVASVTALAVSAEKQPLIYTATFRPLDHAVMLWAYRDAGGPARQPVGGVPTPAVRPTAPVGQTQTRSGFADWLVALPRSPETPYVVLGLVATLALGLAFIAYARRTRGL